MNERVGQGGKVESMLAQPINFDGLDVGQVMGKRFEYGGATFRTLSPPYTCNIADWHSGRKGLQYLSKPGLEIELPSIADDVLVTLTARTRPALVLAGVAVSGVVVVERRLEPQTDTLTVGLQERGIHTLSLTSATPEEGDEELIYEITSYYSAVDGNVDRWLDPQRMRDRANDILATMPDPVRDALAPFMHELQDRLGLDIARYRGAMIDYYRRGATAISADEWRRRFFDALRDAGDDVSGGGGSPDGFRFPDVFPFNSFNLDLDRFNCVFRSVAEEVLTQTFLHILNEHTIVGEVRQQALAWLAEAVGVSVPFLTAVLAGGAIAHELYQTWRRCIQSSFALTGTCGASGRCDHPK